MYFYCSYDKGSSNGQESLQRPGLEWTKEQEKKGREKKKKVEKKVTIRGWKKVKRVYSVCYEKNIETKSLA